MSVLLPASPSSSQSKPAGPEAFFHFQGFTDSALSVLFFARMSVEGDLIDLPHLASGLTRGGNDLTQQILVGTMLELPDGPHVDRDLLFSPRAVRALQLAVREADALSHRIASEHILLGLLREGFAIEGLTLEAVREVVRSRSRPEPLAPPGLPGRPPRL